MSGDRHGQTLELESVFETTWSTWKRMYPESTILSRDIAGSTPEKYDRNSYEEYEESSSILYHSHYYENEPYNLYHVKEKTIILRNGDNKTLFPYSELAKQPIVNYQLGNISLTIIYDEENNFASHFYYEYDGIKLEFELLADRSKYTIDETYGLHIMKDQNGNVFNIKGELIDGNGTSQLKLYPGFNAYWFSAIVFYSSADIYTTSEILNYNITNELNNVYVPADDKTAIIVAVVLVSAPVLLSILITWKKR
jgi:hypothetical protein